MPFSSTALFALTEVPSSGSIMNDLVSIRLMGIDLSTFPPGATQAQGLSGILYAAFTQNPSNGSERTVISLRDFTQYVAYQPGTMRRAGKPFSISSDLPFISYATRMSSSDAFCIGKLLTKSGTDGSG